MLGNNLYMQCIKTKAPRQSSRAQKALNFVIEIELLSLRLIYFQFEGNGVSGKEEFL